MEHSFSGRTRTQGQVTPALGAVTSVIDFGFLALEWDFLRTYNDHKWRTGKENRRN